MAGKSKIILVGGFHEMAELIEDLKIEITGVVDVRIPDCQVCEKYSYLGDDEWLLQQDSEECDQKLVISPDEPALRGTLSQRYLDAGFELATVCFPEVSRSCHLSPGVVVQRLAHISPGCYLGVGVRVNIGALVMHDVTIGDFTTIAPSAVLLGRVSLGSSVYVGANATILPGVSVGEGAVVGAGAVVTKDVGAGETVVGVPARRA